MTDDEHLEDHAWIHIKRAREKSWLEQWGRVMWAVVTMMATGGIISLFAILWWAFQRFVERGGV